MQCEASMMGIFTPDMKFLCLTLWLGGVSPGDDVNANDARPDIT